MAVVHFDGRHLHSANNLTIYIDDEKRGSFDGGSTRTIEVSPGHHIIRCFVYNDASEESYWLGPFSAYFEADMEYDMWPGKRGEGELPLCEGGTHHPSGASTENSSGGGCFAWIVIIAVVLFLISNMGSFITFDRSPSSKDANQTQNVEQQEPPSDEWLDDPDNEQSGFIFPNGDTELIEQWEIEELSDSDLTYAINEIYARHGYLFRSDDLRRYYEQFSWYAGEISADEFSTDVFNQIEQQNWNLLTKERDHRRESAGS